ncbi:MAG TPA: endonuclease III [Candidatus Intestinimonas pullistercoris]|uniref:Endonuclease III n=1 Tax=Candidatus Intestinimonas pullistercoris TaxID=2838623 RepID=A0A9D2NZS6_9FIRM|nr:endonuclease III [uncultured Intestinimonas sp.]HJC41507.1 endonuclease III [Candidatus Intestinimonas pullistercoris]
MTKQKKKADVLSIIEELKRLYPEGICSLNYPKPYELLFSVRLAAQCTDERVNQVTPALFARFPTLESLAEADVSEVETYIHSTGFFRAKARDIVAASRMMVEEFGGRVPDNMEDLLKLPGVGRKTANLILGDVYHTPGVVVADTHCIRISGKLGLTDGTKDPAKVEAQLRAILPPEESNDFCHRLVLHGRAVCTARKPDCQNCTLRPWCAFFQKEVG